tara:strand:+ start:2140 stop:2451 length:312 start_codon:yes stop_codon:yes gene_type:complete
MILIHTISERIENHECEGEFLTENDPIGFRDLVWMMTNEGYVEPSCYPPSGSTYEWLSTHAETDYRTGETEYRTLHYSMKNHPRSAKYWRKAMVAANIIKARK